MLGKCPICGREMSDVNSNLHHLVPKLKGGRQDDTVRLHIICHNKIHSIWSESELMYHFNTIDSIMADVRMKKFSKWVSKKETDFNDSNKMSNNHRRRHRK